MTTSPPPRRARVSFLAYARKAGSRDPMTERTFTLRVRTDTESPVRACQKILRSIGWEVGPVRLNPEQPTK